MKYSEYSKEQLLEEKKKLESQYNRIKAKGLKLDMSRGKPGTDQLAVSNGINLILSGPSQTAGATVYKQSVEKNTEVQAGSSITVYFQTTANMDD